MHYFASLRTWFVTICLAASLASTCAHLAAQTEAVPTPVATNVVLLEIENSVEVLRSGARVWDPGRTNQVLYPGDQVKVGERSRAVLRLANLTLMRVGELSTLQIPEQSADRKTRLNVFKGIYYFFHRDKPGDFQIRTPTVSAVVRGTEFNLEVAGNEKTILALINGEVTATNELGSVELKSGESAVAEAGTRPTKTAVMNAVSVIQWCLYYPAILDLNELSLQPDEEQSLGESLAAYRRGNLLEVVARYPVGRKPISARERVYLAALLLSVGQVAQAQELIAAVLAQNDPTTTGETARQLMGALKKVVAATTRNKATAQPASLATEWLAESYYQQSQSHLEAALAAARQAIVKAPDFGFGWARVAELEFSFGRVGKAAQALEHSLQLMPENAEARALRGFLFAAQNRISEAVDSFDQAIAIDGALGNAWLGRGLCLIQRGKVRAGLQDLQVAATLEPQRAVLRSYLAKGFSEAWDNKRAADEAELAKRLDPADPTAWLYSALIKQQVNRINEGVRDLEKSEELNDNRTVYRSRLLLDQDRAVRSANLAMAYRDTGMQELSLREASRAVAGDYANYSAHLFLANSYDAIRDPRLVELRLETAVVSEYLMANLLAPAGAGTLSRTISQQEYSRLFERDRIRVTSSTEYLSRGDWIQNGAMFGRSGNMGFAIEESYRSENGQRPNNDLDQLNLSVALKQQLTPQDSVYLQAVYFNSDGGDLTRYYDPSSANTRLRVSEKQDPILLAGYHHEWSPNVHTVLLAGRLVDTIEENNPLQSVLLLGKNSSNQVALIAKPALPTAPLDYSSDSEIYTVEAQQIWLTDRHSFVLGGRYQTGSFDTRSRLGPSTPTLVGDESMTLPIPVATGPLEQSTSSDLERFSVYSYYTWKSLDPIFLTAGLAYDQLHSPPNFRTTPLSTQEQDHDQVSPKAGIIWTPDNKTTLRASYARSLGGVSIDQSFRLEPTQVGGFNHAFRSIIPESVVGEIANASFETAAVGIDHRFQTGTYIGFESAILWSDADRSIGTFDLATTFPFAIQPSETRQQLDFRERSFAANINQLLGNEWAIGARYKLSDAKLKNRFPDIPVSVSSGADVNLEGTLHQLDLFALFSHPAGFFAGADALWTSQANRGYTPDLPGDDFWHFNAFAGYRFAQRRVQVALGVLNMSDQDYRLNPLNLTQDLARRRTFTLSMKLAF